MKTFADKNLPQKEPPLKKKPLPKPHAAPPAMGFPNMPAGMPDPMTGMRNMMQAMQTPPVKPKGKPIIFEPPTIQEYDQPEIQEFEDTGEETSAETSDFVEEVSPNLPAVNSPTGVVPYRRDLAPYGGETGAAPFRVFFTDGKSPLQYFEAQDPGEALGIISYLYQNTPRYSKTMFMMAYIAQLSDNGVWVPYGGPQSSTPQGRDPEKDISKLIRKRLK